MTSPNATATATSPDAASPGPPFTPHDHGACAAEGMAAARAVCAAAGLRLTPARARVLEILLESHAALGAYDVLERLRREGRAATPPVAYRALDFLVGNGFAHRIEKLNAFVACARPRAEAGDPPAFLICRRCRQVAETSAAALAAALGPDAARLGFVVERVVVEVEGLCPGCAAREGEGPEVGGAAA